MYDLVIKGAQVADGLGSPLKSAGIAVQNGRIVEIGRIDGTAAETVDADGLILAPGIVDVHTHYDAQLTWDSNATPSPALGLPRWWSAIAAFPSPRAHRSAAI
jgi:N-acyl-D-amino-acid deacylase